MKNQFIKPGTGPVGKAAFGCPVKRSSPEFLPGPWAKLLEEVRRLAARLKWCSQTLTATLREIFDESAYARFLNQRQLISSRAAYATFRQEHEAAKARRPKCC
jgi:hypothetical protein